MFEADVVRGTALAPIGAADLDGDGTIELAYIDRPHLAKELRVWSFINGDLRPLTRASGLTNHRISEDFIFGALIQCNGTPTIITANADWSRRMGTLLRPGTLVSRDLGPFAGRQSLEPR